MSQTAMASAAVPAAEEFLNEAIMRRIDHRAKRLARKFHLCSADRDDLRQDFRMAILQARLRYDPRACPLGRFVLMVVNRRYKHHVRKLCVKAHSPKGGISNAISLEDVSDEIKEMLPDRRQEAELRRVELRHDLDQVLRQVGPVEQEVCRLLMSGHSPSQAARRMNVAPSTVHRCIERIRVRLEKEGYGEVFWNS